MAMRLPSIENGLAGSPLARRSEGTQDLRLPPLQSGALVATTSPKQSLRKTLGPYSNDPVAFEAKSHDWAMGELNKDIDAEYSRFRKMQTNAKASSPASKSSPQQEAKRWGWPGASADAAGLQPSSPKQASKYAVRQKSGSISSATGKISYTQPARTHIPGDEETRSPRRYNFAASVPAEMPMKASQQPHKPATKATPSRPQPSARIQAPQAGPIKLAAHVLAHGYLSFPAVEKKTPVKAAKSPVLARTGQNHLDKLFVAQTSPSPLKSLLCLHEASTPKNLKFLKSVYVAYDTRPTSAKAKMYGMHCLYPEMVKHVDIRKRAPKRELANTVAAQGSQGPLEATDLLKPNRAQLPSLCMIFKAFETMATPCPGVKVLHGVVQDRTGQYKLHGELPDSGPQKVTQSKGSCSLRSLRALFAVDDTIKAWSEGGFSSIPETREGLALLHNCVEPKPSAKPTGLANLGAVFAVDESMQTWKQGGFYGLPQSRQGLAMLCNSMRTDAEVFKQPKSLPSLRRVMAVDTVMKKWDAEGCNGTPQHREGLAMLYSIMGAAPKPAGKQCRSLLKLQHASRRVRSNAFSGLDALISLAN
eukprot:CAMPEP_0174306104 /NCGR_PEP_ID=MMETSP0810-20121108/231_1 /TAXON_ID=73025 ORGANISM="Eutreptiella gymnastica-like, Strain CCMP1594" /NCGR_SAMPLE_ID=MMETSP0810 /ASSEMBLY_ACC=CAM_ASM_000659 /LENGTH=588 /DNA_ID=CAMNT_0015412713 /DNA_START=29 /DNA_END=1795 /DNA_ORIENTATION=+